MPRGSFCSKACALRLREGSNGCSLSGAAGRLGRQRQEQLEDSHRYHHRYFFWLLTFPKALLRPSVIFVKSVDGYSARTESGRYCEGAFTTVCDFNVFEPGMLAQAFFLLKYLKPISPFYIFNFSWQLRPQTDYNQSIFFAQPKNSL